MKNLTIRLFLFLSFFSWQTQGLDQKKTVLMTANISYGQLHLPIGNADIFLTTDTYGDIISVNVSAKVGVLGIKQKIQRSVKIDELIRGKKVRFGMQGSSQDTLVIQAERNFSLTGGNATFKIWDGKKFQKEYIKITRENKQYIIRKSGVKVSALSINMRGRSISSMHVAKYSLMASH